MASIFSSFLNGGLRDRRQDDLDEFGILQAEFDIKPARVQPAVVAMLGGVGRVARFVDIVAFPSA